MIYMSESGFSVAASTMESNLKVNRVTEPDSSVDDDDTVLCEHCGILLDECLADRCTERAEWMAREYR